jgi:hypothetical protein
MATVTPLKRQRQRQRRHRLLLIAGVGLILLVAIAFLVVANTDKDEAPTITGPASTPTPETHVPDNPYVKPFGQTIRIAEAYEVTIEPPKKLTPSDTSAGELGVRSVSVAVLIRNDTEQVLDANAARINATFNGQPTSNVWDTDKGVGMFVTKYIQPGATGRAEYGFSLPGEAEGDLRIEVRIGMSTDLAVFYGRA